MRARESVRCRGVPEPRHRRPLQSVRRRGLGSRGPSKAHGFSVRSMATQGRGGLDTDETLRARVKRERSKPDAIHGASLGSHNRDSVQWPSGPPTRRASGREPGAPPLTTLATGPRTIGLGDTHRAGSNLLMSDNSDSQIFLMKKQGTTDRLRGRCVLPGHGARLGN